MRDTVALQRYQQRHTETGLPCHSFTQAHWHQVIVLPAYREAPSLLQQLTQLPACQGRVLVILVLNRPESDSDPLANAELRSALEHPHLTQATRDTVPVYCLNPHADLYLYDMERRCGPTPTAMGVGLARKTGCDLALQLKAAGGISGQWLCSTDADATLPQDYFAQLDRAAADAVAAVFPFRHLPGVDGACDTATALYELRLHHYVLGLEYAGSPYAFHTLGSSLAVPFTAYAHVRGFPKRAGAEDFYLLNKLAKLGDVARLQGACIALQSRQSARVPFGTGPAVAAIMAAEEPWATPLFYHPQCFAALGALLDILPLLADAPEQDIAALMLEHPQQRSTRPRLSSSLAKQVANTLHKLGIATALHHCQRQAKSSAQFQRQFHQWFDGFRTLKFIHALRDGGLPLRSLAELDDITPQLWPIAAELTQDITLLQNAVRQHWCWQ